LCALLRVQEILTTYRKSIDLPQVDSYIVATQHRWTASSV